MPEIKDARLALNDCITLSDLKTWRSKHGEDADALWEALSIPIARQLQLVAQIMENWEIDLNTPPNFVRYLYPLDDSYSIQIYTEEASGRYKNLVVHHRITGQKRAKTLFDINIKIEKWLSHRQQIFRLAIDTLELQRAISVYKPVDPSRQPLNPEASIWKF